jgi:hypothetical protein
VKYLPAILTVCFALLFWGQSQAHELHGVTPEYQQWASSVEITAEAQKRLPWHKCCNHAEIFRTKFLPLNNGEDGYLYEVIDGVWKRIPNDIIHWGEKAPDGQNTLFIYQGKETCFFPAEGGI